MNPSKVLPPGVEGELVPYDMIPITTLSYHRSTLNPVPVFNPKSSSPGTIERPEVEESSPITGGHWVVVVYDNPVNTYEEVIYILILATQCTFDEAAIETWEIDHLGKSVVHHGKEDECSRAANVISQIGIKVEVREE